MVVRDGVGDPVVIRNAPLLDDGTPMPTRYWLVGREARLAVDRLESSGGVRVAESAIDPAQLRAAHQAYATERDAALPPGWAGPARPAGWGAPGGASSACTPTTPGTWPGVMTRSGAGWGAAGAGRGDRLRNQLDPTVDRPPGWSHG